MQRLNNNQLMKFNIVRNFSYTKKEGHGFKHRLIKL